jgi:hypothetical protein
MPVVTSPEDCINRLMVRAGEAQQMGLCAIAADLRQAANELARLAMEVRDLRLAPRVLPPSGRRWLAG